MHADTCGCDLVPGHATPVACAAMLLQCDSHPRLQPTHPDEQLLRPFPPCLDHLQVIETASWVDRHGTRFAVQKCKLVRWRAAR
jgi:hypothetical protein